MEYLDISGGWGEVTGEEKLFNHEHDYVFFTKYCYITSTEGWVGRSMY